MQHSHLTEMAIQQQIRCMCTQSIALKKYKATCICSSIVLQSLIQYVCALESSNFIFVSLLCIYQIAKQKSDDLAEKIESLEKQFDEKLKVITTNAEKSVSEYTDTNTQVV